MDLIPSPSPSVKIQIMSGKVCLRCEGKTLLVIVNKLLKTKSLLTSSSNVKLYKKIVQYYFFWKERLVFDLLSKATLVKKFSCFNPSNYLVVVESRECKLFNQHTFMVSNYHTCIVIWEHNAMPTETRFTSYDYWEGLVSLDQNIIYLDCNFLK